MKAINKSRNIILADDCRVALGALKRAKGLLGRKGMGKSEALVLKPCNSVHSFFMRFAIDLLFIDKNSRVVRIIKEFKPFRISPICFRAAYVIEFPSGAIRPESVQPGDTISIE
ncbi:MAG: DUF192 domain-containing protein [Candidatus Omnitrophica bacterium]|nr:DUF192 domain-containing protein [Candidatus Omnitrophota bacterium]